MTGLIIQIENALHNDYKYLDIEKEVAKLPLSIILHLTPKQIAETIVCVKRAEDVIFRKYN